jgi:pyruvate formate lyase activating enzyme
LLPANAGGDVNLDVVKDRVLENIGFLDALGFTGGEPCLQPKPLRELCRWAKTQGLATFLNTNASHPGVITALLEQRLLDYLAFDLKAPLRAEAYQRVAGLGSCREHAEHVIANIRATLEVCKRFGVPLEARTTIVPTLMDDEASIREIAAVARECTIYVLQEFSPVGDVLDETLRQLRPPDREVLVSLAEIALDEGVREVYIRTRRGGMERVPPIARAT